MKFSLKVTAVVAIVMLLLSQISQNTQAEAAKKKRKSASASQSQQKTLGLSSLVGVWESSSSGTGTGTDPRQPGVDVSLNADDIVLKIESVKFSESEGEGKADVIFMGVITDVRNEIICQRSWEYSVPYDMKREGENSWSFSTEFIDGEDKITLSFTTGQNALIRWEGFVADETYPEEKYFFDVTCSAKKD